MFNKVINFLKKLFGRKPKRVRNKPVVDLKTIRTSNGGLNHKPWNNDDQKNLNKKIKRRVRNKIARASRNAQHKKAA